MRYRLLILLLMKCLASAGQGSTNVSIAMPPVALVALLPSGGANVTLTMVAPNEAGTIVGTGSSNNTNYLIFTSAVASGASRSIKGDIVGTLPPGIKLKLSIAPYSGSGQGFSAGSSTVTGNVYLTNLATTFINNIHGAYTGISAGNGFRLTYSLEIDSYTNIRSGTSNVTVRYTMVDN